MRAHDIKNLTSNLEALNIPMPQRVTQLVEFSRTLANLPTSEGKRGLEGINTVDDIAAEIERRAMDAVLAKERTTQARMMQDAVERSIDTTLINATDDLIEQLRPAVTKAHATIVKATEKMNGNFNADAAIKHDAGKEYKAALDAYEVIDRAATVRTKLYRLSYPDLDRGVERAVTFWAYDTLAAWDAYQALPDAGTGAGNHALTAQTDGVTFVWATTEQAEAQSLALGKAQRAQREANRPADTYTFDPTVGAYVSDGF